VSNPVVSGVDALSGSRLKRERVNDAVLPGRRRSRTARLFVASLHSAPCKVNDQAAHRNQALQASSVRRAMRFMRIVSGEAIGEYCDPQGRGMGRHVPTIRDERH
jgi:hypothetical protein